jgi:putative transcriptional regulator
MNALDDSDNLSVTDEQFDRKMTGRAIREIRAKSGLAQNEFPERFHVPLAQLRDWERGGYLPDSHAMAYFKVIEHSPESVEAALGTK